MAKRWLPGLVCLLAATIPATARADSTPNTFKTICSLVASSPQQFDPIVYPGQNPAGHLHEFFGGTSVNPSSTGQELQLDGAQIHTTCADRFDTADYWVPEMKQCPQGVLDFTSPLCSRTVPHGMDVYYARHVPLELSNGTQVNSVTVFPTDFRQIIGNHNATSPQARAITKFRCLNESTGDDSVPMSCPDPNNPLVADLFFGGCWKGAGSQRLSNNAEDVQRYTINNNLATCPSGYNTPIPVLQLTIRYGAQPYSDCRAINVTNPCVDYVLSSGSPEGGATSIYSYHGDFLQGWGMTGDGEDLPALVARCDNGTYPTPACGTQTTSPTGDAFTGIQ